MRRLILYCCTFIASATSVAQVKKAETVTFSGTTDTLYNNSYMVMYTREKKDSAMVTNGKFAFIIPYNGPGRYMFYSKYELTKKQGYSPFGILVSGPGIVNIEADMESMSKTKVSNVPDNDLYLNFNKVTFAARENIRQKLNERFGVDVIKNLRKGDAKYDEVVKFSSELNAANALVEGVRLEEFIKKNPSSFASVYLLYGMLGTLPVDQLQKLYGLLDNNYKTSSTSLDIAKKIQSMGLVAVGKTAPDFEQLDTAGNIVRLSSFRGQYVLLDFWASWCGPCRMENPNLVSAFKKYHSKGFTVLGVSLDQPGKRENWLKAINQDKLSWTNVSDLKFWDNAVAKLYGIQAIPQNFLLDKAGKIIAINIKGDDLNSKLAEIFPN